MNWPHMKMLTFAMPLPVTSMWTPSAPSIELLTVTVKPAGMVVIWPKVEPSSKASDGAPGLASMSS